ncbi:MAG: hypothetical protein ACREK2_08450 [Gemmatimonadota bacterium]
MLTPIDLVLSGAIAPGEAFGLTLPLDQVAERYRANGRAARDQGAAHSLKSS